MKDLKVRRGQEMKMLCGVSIRGAQGTRETLEYGYGCRTDAFSM